MTLIREPQPGREGRGEPKQKEWVGVNRKQTGKHTSGKEI